MNILKVDGLSKKIRRKIILDNLKLEVKWRNNRFNRTEWCRKNNIY